MNASEVQLKGRANETDVSFTLTNLYFYPAQSTDHDAKRYRAGEVTVNLRPFNCEGGVDKLCATTL